MYITLKPLLSTIETKGEPIIWTYMIIGIGNKDVWYISDFAKIRCIILS